MRSQEGLNEWGPAREAVQITFKEAEPGAFLSRTTVVVAQAAVAQGVE